MAQWAYKLDWFGNSRYSQFQTEIRNRLRRSAAMVANQVKANINISAKIGSEPRNRHSRPGNYPRSMTRGLIRSIQWDLENDTNARVFVDAAGPAKKYAERLENGGVILSHGKMMAVPISPEAVKHSLSGSGPRTFPRPLVRIRRRNKTMLLVEIPVKQSGFGVGVEASRIKAWIIHYLLTPKVTIEARPYLRRTFEQMIPRIMDIFREPMPFP